MPFFGETGGSKAPKHTAHESAQGIRINAGPFIGIVKNNVDPQRAGRLQVWISELGGDPDDQSAWRTVSYASPFYGVTPPQSQVNGTDTRPTGQNFETNPHSYGFWMVPPDLGVKVLCMFVNGDPFKGYWIACIPDWPNMHMLPAMSGNDKNPLPLVEYNDDAPDDITSLNSFHNRQTQAHQEQVKILQKQGLDQDKDRGLITSSAFRESPSAVFGFSTPGTLLKGEEGQQTGTGRKGGHTFVMDDGDAETNNQLIRIRSSSGHMLMMNDSSGFIYVTNADGTAWFELDSTGNINFYADGDIQMAAKGNIHFEAGKSFKVKAKEVVDLLSDGMGNLTGKKGINLSSEGSTKVEGKKGLHLKGENTYLTGDKCMQLNGGKHLDLGAGCINLNSSQPTKAQGAQTAQGPQGMPTKEPWQGHKAGGKGRSSGVSRGGASRTDVLDSGPIGTTGGVGPGPTGFRQGTEIDSGQLSGFGTGRQTATSTVNTNIPPEGRALLDTIASTEAPGYNVIYGGRTFSSYADHPRIAVPIASGPNVGLTSSAAGRYQFLGSSWDRQAATLGLKDFSPANQDAAAWNYAKEVYKAKTGGDLEAALKSGDPNKIAQVGRALNGTWTSLPGGIEAGTNSSRFANTFNANLNKYDFQGVPPNTSQRPPDNTVGYVAPNEEENQRDQQRNGETSSPQQDFGNDPAVNPPQQDFGNDSTVNPPQQDFGNDPAVNPPQQDFGNDPLIIDTSSDRNTETFDPSLSGEIAPETIAPSVSIAPAPSVPESGSVNTGSPPTNDYAAPNEEENVPGGSALSQRSNDGDSPAPGTSGDLGKPVGGGSKPPGAGGQGAPGTPTNQSPQSSTKPAC
jgi:muramidase (phage lysozyme)